MREGGFIILRIVNEIRVFLGKSAVGHAFIINRVFVLAITMDESALSPYIIQLLTVTEVVCNVTVELIIESIVLLPEPSLKLGS